MKGFHLFLFRVSRFAFLLFSAPLIVALPVVILTIPLLSKEGISLKPFLPQIIRAAGASLNGAPIAKTSWRVSIGDAALLWGTRAENVRVLFRDLRFYREGAAGQEVETRVARLSANFQTVGLFGGRLAPTEISLHDASILLTRSPQGALQIDMLLPEETQGETMPESQARLLREALLFMGSARPPFEALRAFRVENLSLDAAAPDGKTRRIARFSLLLVRKNGSLEGHLAPIKPSDNWEMLLRTEPLAEKDGYRIALEVSHLPIARLARLFPELDNFVHLESEFSGELSAQISADGAIRAAEARFRGEGGGAVAFPAISPARHIISDAEMEIALNMEERALYLKDFRYEAAGAQTRIAGKAIYTEENGDISRFDLSLRAENLSFYIPGASPESVPAKKAELEIALHVSDRAMEIKTFALEVEGGTVELRGRLMQGIQTPGTDLQARFVNIPLAYLPRFFPAAANRKAHQWFVANVRDGHLTEGEFFFRAPPRAGLSVSQQSDFTSRGKVIFRDTAFRYSRSAALVTDADGECVFENRNLSCRIADASSEAPGADGKILITSASYDRAEDTTTIKVAGHGGANVLLQWFDNLPSHLLSAQGVSSANAIGHGAFRADLTWKRGAKSWMRDTQLDAQLRLENFSLEPIFARADESASASRPLALHDGDIVIHLTNSGLLAKGSIALQGVGIQGRWEEKFSYHKGHLISSVQEIDLETKLDSRRLAALGFALPVRIEGSAPFRLRLKRDRISQIAEGSVMADMTNAFLSQSYLGWRKPSGEKADFAARLFSDGEILKLEKIRFASASAGVSGFLFLDRALRLKEGGFDSIRITPDPSDPDAASAEAEIQMHRAEDGTLRVEVKGARFDARHALDRILGGGRENAQRGGDGGDGGGGREESENRENRENQDSETVFVSGEIGSLEAHHGIALQDARFSLARADGKIETLRLDGKLQKGDFQVRLGRKGKKRLLLVASENAGLVLRGLDLYSGVHGGRLKIEAEIARKNPAEDVIRGEINIRNFSVVGAEVLRDIMKQSSLDNPSEQASGEQLNAARDQGVAFQRLQLPFKMEADRIELRDGWAAGPLLGLSLYGSYDRRSKRVAMRGTLTPAYVINAALENVPILGPIITGRKGEGVLGVTYAIDGPAEKPVVRVNPVSALVPGFLRRMFEFRKDSPSRGRGEAGASN